ncbi:AraC family transcriptional regulator [Pelomonas sp. CA6]|uniref:AraC family transcriptional regulator n=1 Tax=Pelomonas sp. CA6 TaxID=2907999 RepID=UPI001F4C2DB9|nr:AraC family transcriptional regulator [Pelomonas sp. CA6]MCH7343463.1 AraC family transcriptional regulator [Pelomonas sp. CA6]
MPPDLIDSPQALQDWFLRSGVTSPLLTCVGPLPRTRASIARWSRRQADSAIQVVSPHPDSYRIAVMLEPLESQIWVGDRVVWGGMIGANRFRICPPGAPSRWRQLSGCDIVNLFIPVDTVEALCADAGLPDGARLAGTLFAPDRQVLDLVWKMLDAQAAAGPLAARYCDGLVDALLCYLLERHAAMGEARAGGPGLSGGRLRKVLAFLAENATRDPSISEMAQLCAMSDSHFSREFRAAMGLPPHQYVMKLRLERACELLRGSEAKLVDIALELGFTSASHFSRAFAQRYGQPPASYRRQRG